MFYAGSLSDLAKVTEGKPICAGFFGLLRTIAPLLADKDRDIWSNPVLPHDHMDVGGSAMSGTIAELIMLGLTGC